MFLYSLIQLLDYPLVFLDLSKEPKELTDSADEDNDESHSETKSSPVVLPYRQFAQDIMVISSNLSRSLKRERIQSRWKRLHILVLKVKHFGCCKLVIDFIERIFLYGCPQIME